MATYTAQAIGVAGTVPTLRTAASGDKLQPDNNCVLWVVNGDSSSHDVTFTNPGNNADGEANPDPVRTVANATSKAVLVNPRWADPSDGLVALTWSATTSMSFYYVRV
jgi:hypothetical protein